MIEKIEGIVTDIVRHNDKHNVVTLYTRGHGRMAFLVPVGKSKTGRMRNALFSLMAVVSADVNIRAGKELHTLSNAAPLRLWHGLYSNPVKGSLLFFITEFCHRLLRQYPADEGMWRYLISSLEWLDAAPESRIANFHIAFLVGMAGVAGIEPSVSGWREGEEFDMLSGEMVDRSNTLFLRRKAVIPEEESRFLPMLLRMNFNNMHRFRFSRARRNHLLDRIISYYGIHLPVGVSFKSLDVLRELYAP